jgi:glycosyltransferase domain-containing protein
MITFLIPTINRSDLIIKYLDYLKKNKFNGQVLLGDSSNKEHYQETERYIRQLDCEYEVQQFSFPNMYPHLCIQEMLSEIKFPYSMYIHDDDYLIVETLYKCVDFLDSNPEYSGVGGKAIVCHINENNRNKIDDVYEYRVSEVMPDTAVERLDELMNNYSVINFSLARTKDFLTRWPCDKSIQDRGIGGEYLPAAMLASQGKVKMLEDLFVVRQIHARRSLLPSYFDTFLLPAWAPSMSYSIEYVSKHVATIDSIPYDDAYKTVKSAWTNYYTKVILKDHHHAKKSKKIRNFAKSIPGLKAKYQLSRRLINKLIQRHGVSLPELLKTSSPYHNDFIKVYDIITNEASA